MSDETRTEPPEDSDRTPTHFDAVSAPQPAGEAVGPPGYELREVVGQGGMGVVYRARDLAMHRDVAVKILLDRYAPDGGTAMRFLDEARITGQLQHPGSPAVHVVGTLPDGRPYLVMKLIKGDTLADKIKAKATLDPLAVFESIAQAVGYAHAHGVIHRDLKPANVMVGGFGEVQVMDWGLAKVLASVAASARRGPADDPDATTPPTEIRDGRDSDTPFTQHGSMIGTPAFMPPEQAAGELGRIDARSDVFGLGAILCALLTGEPPYTGKDAESVRVKAVRGDTADAVARLSASGADPGVVALCQRCLAFEPSDRPANADAVATAVAALRAAADDRARQAERATQDAEVRRQVTSRAAFVVAAVLVLGLAGSGVGLIRADAARHEAEVERDAAKAARHANAVISFYENRLLAPLSPKK